MHASVSPQTNWVQLLKEQARITAVAPVEALNAGADAAGQGQPRACLGPGRSGDDD
jgi:hypothetical protein